VTTTLTSKGQMTLPKDVRDRLGLKPGDHLDVAVENHVIILTPRTVTLDALCSMLPPPKRAVSIPEMNRAIEEGALE
jgi:antitoxin PrlF